MDSSRNNKQKDNWTEQDSQAFIQYGDFFVPYRQQQAKVIAHLLMSVPNLQKVIDLCCGAGSLSETILEKFPNTEVSGYDLSDEMLAEAEKRLSRFSERFTTHNFDLADEEWRKVLNPADAFVSSLAIHHLNHLKKKQLFRDLYKHLNTGGVLLVADIIQPSTQVGYQVAASLWDQWVKEAAEDAAFPKAYDVFINEQWNYFEHPDADSIDQPSALLDQLKWMEKAGFKKVDVFWMTAGHAIFGGWK